MRYARFATCFAWNPRRYLGYAVTRGLREARVRESGTDGVLLVRDEVPVTA